MYISKITVKGFRSFGPDGATIPVNDKLVGFIGLNSSGKTTALEAIRKVFGNSSERDLLKSDFHVGINENIAEITGRTLSIEVILRFDDVSDEDDDAVPHFFNHMVVEEEDGEPYLRVRLEASWQDSAMKPEGLIESELYFIKVAKEAAEAVDSKHYFPKHLRNLVQVFYVPAIRKPSEQIKYASGSILYRVLKKIKWDAGFKDTFQHHVDDISGLFKSQGDVSLVENSIKSFWQKFHTDDRYREADLNFGNSDFESILKKIEIAFTPTGTKRPYAVDDLGEGYRSLFYLTLVCSLLDVEENLASRIEEEEIGPSRPLLTILAIEEPENHIAPQLLGRVVNILNAIVQKDRTQVLLSSHTPAIVKRLDPECICHFRITTEYETQVNTITLPDEEDEAYKFVKQAVHNYPEIYFARLVVIGEGESEEILFSRLMDVKDLNFDNNLITFAPLGHRFVNHIWKLLKTLNIDHVTLLDLDTERGGGGWGRIKYVVDQLLEIGVPPKDILTIEGGEEVTPKDLLSWEVKDAEDVKMIMTWVESFEKYNVYFSAPLDLDFLLIKHYPSAYADIVPKNGGPRIPDKSKQPDKYAEKLQSAIQATLKSESAVASSYSDDDKELMIWYNYHFLGRGKPSTHIQALAALDNEELEENCPKLFDRIFRKISRTLKIEEDEKA